MTLQMIWKRYALPVLAGSALAFAGVNSYAAEYDIYIHGAFGKANNQPAQYCADPNRTEDERDDDEAVVQAIWDLGSSVMRPGHSNNRFVAYDGWMPFDADNGCSATSVVTERLNEECQASDGNSCRLVCYSMGCAATMKYLSDNHEAVKNGDIAIEKVVAYASVAGGAEIGQHADNVFRFIQNTPEGEEVEVRQCNNNEQGADPAKTYNGMTRSELCQTIAAMDLNPNNGITDYHKWKTSIAMRTERIRSLFNHELNGEVPVFHIAGHSARNMQYYGFNVDDFSPENDAFFDVAVHGLNDGLVTFHSACGYREAGAYTECDGDDALLTNHYIYKNKVGANEYSTYSAGSQSYDENHLSYFTTWGVPIDVDYLNNYAFPNRNDGNAPAISDLYPGIFVVDVPFNDPITVTFDKPIDPATLALTLTDTTAGNDLPFNITVRNNTLEVRHGSVAGEHSPWPVDSVIYLSVDAVADMYGNAIASAKPGGYFLTSADVTAPQVTQRVPAHGSEDVSVDTTITFTFDEPIDPDSLNRDNVVLLEYAGSYPQIPVDWSLSADGLTLTVTPITDLDSGTVYAALMGYQTVTDLAGNNLYSGASAMLFFTE